MKRFILTALILALISVVAWKSRQPSLNLIRAEGALLREQRAAVGSLRSAAPAGPAESIDPNELDRLRALLPELARLRGSIGALRLRTNHTPEQLQTEAAKSRAEAARIRARHEAKEQSNAMRNSIGSCLMLVTVLAEITDGSVPRTWEEVRSRLTQPTPDEKPQLPQLRAMMEQASGPDGILHRFEILPTPAEVILKRRQPNPQVPLIREREPRPQPDGGYSRYYAWMDGRTEEITLDEGKFEAWEAEHLRAEEK